MSIFGELDVASANENPFFKPDGKYISKLTKAEVRYSKAGNKGMPLEYTIMEGQKQGKTINEWKPVPEIWETQGYPSQEDLKDQTNYSDKTKEDAERNLAFLKQRLKQFGFSAEEMNSVTPEQLLGLPWLEIEIKNSGGQERIYNIEIYADKLATEGDPFS